MMPGDVKIYAMVVAVTERAVLLRVRSVGRKNLDPQPEEWIPKSQILDCSSEVSDLLIDEVINAMIPGWLATEKELSDEG